MRTLSKHSNRVGFTLVEIMIVVAIIGILIAIAIPGFVKARKTSQARACQENLQKIDSAKEQWALEEKTSIGVVPTAEDLFGVERYVKVTPTCPASGDTYNATINAIGENPTCPNAGIAGYEGHKLPEDPTPVPAP